MKQVSLLVILSLLSACSTGSGSHGGTDTSAGAPGKSVYEIWLEQGNVGSEQDFLDSLIGGGKEEPSIDVSTKNFNKQAELDELVEYGDNMRGHSYKYTITQKPWAKHNGFSQYDGSYIQESGARVKFVYNEKELKLGNYGAAWYETLYQNSQYPTLNSYQLSANGYISNRDIEYSANSYKPADNAVFKGGTLAYLYKAFKYTPQEAAPTLIKGDAVFAYNPTNPQLVLDFDNYYKFVIDFSNVYHDGNNGLSSANGTINKASVSVSGINSTRNKDFDLETGKYESSVLLRTQHLKKGGVEEAFGTYTMWGSSLGGGGEQTWGGDDFSISGAFGGEKQ